MKLIKAYVSSFGGLKDFEYTFNDKINTIKEDNGWGKTTFANFLKCMFYGISSSKRDIDENDRIKYKPWNSTEKFGGYLIFERAGQTFRIERFFGNKSSEDTVRLIDENTGKEFSSTDNLGERIFKINEEGFLSSTYLSQKELETTSNASITAKYNEVCGISDTELFDKAIKNLEEKKKVYVKTGNKGLIAELKEQISRKNVNLINIEKTENLVGDLKIKIAEQEKQVNQIEDKVKILRNKVNQKKVAETSKNTYNETLLLLKKQQEEISKANEILRENYIDEEKISVVKNCITDLRICLNRKSELEKNAQKNANNQNKKGLIACAIFAVLFAICAVATIAITPILTAVFGVLSFASLCALILQKNKESNNKNPLLEEINELTEKCSAYERGLDAFFADFSVFENYSYEERLMTVLNALNSRSNAEKSKENFEKILLTLDNGVENVKGSLIDLENELEAEEFLLKRLKNDLTAKIITLNDYLKELDAKIEVESEKQELEQRKIQADKEYKIITKTLDFLRQADNDLKVNMRAPLEESLNKYLNLISSKEMKAKIDVDLNVFIDEKGAGREADYFSKGYRNVFEICKRFALIDVVFTQEKPFIILDDPFYNLDDDKVKRSLSLLNKMAEEYQILYLVCHDSRVI